MLTNTNLPTFVTSGGSNGNGGGGVKSKAEVDISVVRALYKASRVKSISRREVLHSSIA